MTSLSPREPLLTVSRVKKLFPIKNVFGRSRQAIKAVNDVSFHLNEGETYGLVGESGCGKSTLGRLITRLIEASDGEVIYDGRNILKLSGKQLRSLRKHLQMVFQDPFSSLNPRHRIGRILEETLIIHGIPSQNRHQKIADMLEKVGLREEHFYSYPHEFSGGQRQRIGLARALMLNPKIIVCDEPVSALDVVIQSQVINLMKKLQAEFGLTYLFIAHDISVIRHISDRVGVMYLGEMMEEAPVEQLFTDPLHPYTQSLLSAVPVPNPSLRKERIHLKGEVPNALNPPEGCVFHTRCMHATDECSNNKPEKLQISSGHYVACHLYA